MQKRFDEQFRRWIARLPFSSLRARLLLFLALLPACGFILYSAIEARQQAAEVARDNVHWLMRLLALQQQNLVELVRQQLLGLAQLPVVRRPEQAALCSHTFAALHAQDTFYANLGVIEVDGTLRSSALPHSDRVRPQ